MKKITFLIVFGSYFVGLLAETNTEPKKQLVIALIIMIFFMYTVIYILSKAISRGIHGEKELENKIGEKGYIVISPINKKIKFRFCFEILRDGKVSCTSYESSKKGDKKIETFIMEAGVKKNITIPFEGTITITASLVNNTLIAQVNKTIYL